MIRFTARLIFLLAILFACGLGWYFDQNQEKAIALVTQPFKKSSYRVDLFPKNLDMIQAFEEDDIVRVQLISLDKSKGSQSQCYKAKLKDKIKRSTFIRENRKKIVSSIGLWLTEFNSKVVMKNEPKVSKFYRALAMADLLDGKYTDFGNPKIALNLLEDLMKLDSKNSAPVLYAALIYDSMGLTEKSNLMMWKARNTKYFDAYSVTAMKSIFRLVKNESDLVGALDLALKLPTPSYRKLAMFLNQPEHAQYAEQMMAAGKNPELLYFDTEWSAQQYVAGRYILRQLAPEAAKSWLTYTLLVKNKKNLNPQLTPPKVAALASNHCLE